MATEQDEIVTVTLGGVNLGPFDNVGGGGMSAGVTKYRQGGDGKEVADKVKPSPDDLTVGRRFDPATDNENLRLALSQAGVGDVVVNRQPCDVNKNPIGKPRTSIGTLDTVQEPSYDSTSTTPQMWGMTLKVTAIA